MNAPERKQTMSMKSGRSNVGYNKQKIEGQDEIEIYANFS